MDCQTTHATTMPCPTCGCTCNSFAVISPAGYQILIEAAITTCGNDEYTRMRKGIELGLYDREMRERELDAMLHRVEREARAFEWPNWWREQRRLPRHRPQPRRIIPRHHRCRRYAARRKRHAFGHSPRKGCWR